MRKLLPLRLLSRRPKSAISAAPFVGEASSPASGHLLRAAELRHPLACFARRSLIRFYSGSPGIIVRPELLNKAAASATTFPAALESLLQRGLRSLEASLQRRRFDAGQLFSSPRRYWRYLSPTPDGVVLGLIATNVAVFFLWWNVDTEFMRKNFMISLDNFKGGRLHTLITSAFSHVESGHLVTNMFGLYFFGKNIGRLFGPDFLLKLYIAGAIGGSVFFLMHKAYIASSLQGRQGWNYARTSGLGASAAVNAIILLDIFLFPTSTCYLYFMIPVPAILLGAVLIGSDLWRVKKGDGYVSGSAHLGGAVVAAVVFACLKKGWI